METSGGNFFRSPLSTILEYSGIIRSRSNHLETESLINSGVPVGFRDHIQHDSVGAGNAGEVSIRIIGADEEEQDRVQSVSPSSQGREVALQNEVFVQPMSRTTSSTSVLLTLDEQGDSRSDRGEGEDVLQSLNVGVDEETVSGVGPNSRESSYQRYDIPQAARWIEQILPFSLLLLVVFIRQHLQDCLVCQMAMVFKCILLMCYKNSGGRNYRKQGQMLTLVEYLLLLYRALLPAPVWYRFFLNKEYGSIFSSLMTGLYLTFKLTSSVEKVQCFLVALKALSHREIHYGTCATAEQVNAAGDLCAICQEKMHAPILLRCKHIFCEDCVSEWFERQRTCPLCRTMVKPAGLRSFSDGSTCLFFQMF